MDGNIGHYVDQAIQTLRDGFANINNPKGLLIALAATIFMGGWKQWLPIAIGATVIHLLIGVLAPVLSEGNGQVRLPGLMEQDFWVSTGVLFVGYAIVIAVFFFLKKMLFKGGGKGGH